MITVPKFKKASQAATWIADTVSKKTWCQTTLAEEADTGLMVEVDHPRAAKFCALGFIGKASQGYDVNVRQALQEALFKKVFSKEDRDSGYFCIEDVQIADWNDNTKRTPTHVKAAFREAAEILKAKEKVAAKEARAKRPVRGEFI